MTDYSTLSADYLSGLARQPAALPPASIGDVWSAEWKRAGLETLTGIGKPLDDAYGELSRAVESATGKPVAEFAPGLADAASTDERAALIRAQVATLPEDQRRPIEPLLDVRRRASEIALKTEKDANEIYSSTYGLSGVATAWAAGLARQAVDPVNLAALPLGGPLKGPVVKMLLREAAIGGLTQAIQEPAIETGRAGLGLEAGFGRAAGNIAGAAIGAGGMAGLFRVGSAALRMARGERPGVTDAISDGVPVSDSAPGPMTAPTDSAIGRLAQPEDLAAAARVVERDQLVDAVSPPIIPADMHAAGVAAAERAIEAGQSIEAWHGSPHDFERFDLAKIGTGEGAQVYGHGLYFAEKEAVARGYSKSTSNADFIRKVRELYDEHESPDFARQAIAESKDFTEGQKRLLAALEKDDWFGFDYPHQAVSAALRDAKNFDPSPETLAAIANVGNVYKVSIAAEAERLVDFDKPLKSQSDYVKAALGDFVQGRIGNLERTFPRPEAMPANVKTQLDLLRSGDITMLRLFEELSTRRPEQAMVLRELGIPGIKYLDQGSRKAGEGTRNIVLFDDSLVRITHKNDAPVRLEDMPVPETLRGEAPPKPEAPQMSENLGGLANTDQLINKPTAPAALGDPVLAKEFERVLAEAGDIEIHVGDRKLKASAAIAEAEKDAAAARELTDCIGATA